ncbi:hypothetical protein [Leptospira idonii]|uniref:hypothetical protein n=1 Tax=Leptospira idonii TaxID=1193500 RepID=UPI0014382B64|nr:hypothetical protein [Leptospira idonii]
MGKIIGKYFKLSIIPEPVSADLPLERAKEGLFENSSISFAFKGRENGFKEEPG